MKIRVKFGKEGALCYIGHLDVLRSFQKIFRRAGVEMCYSHGFSPHPIMSFALPLGLGLSSEGEYLDAEIDDNTPLSGLKEKLSAAGSEDLPIYAVYRLPDGAENAMSTVGQAEYLAVPPAALSREELERAARDFLAKKEFIVLKQSKTREAEADIRPMVFALSLRQDGLFLRIAAGSSANLKPELLLSLLSGKEIEAKWTLRRLDLLDREGRSLGKTGDEIV